MVFFLLQQEINGEDIFSNMTSHGNSSNSSIANEIEYPLKYNL